jgi:uncharacterized membrane protein
MNRSLDSLVSSVGSTLSQLRALVDQVPAHPLADAALIGVATGGRTTAGLAALAWTVPAGEVSRSTVAPIPKPLALFEKTYSKPVQTAALAGELIVDKLPSTTSRLRPGPLFGRISTGSTAATALAQRHADPTWPAAAVGGIGAAAGSWLGASWRRRAARRGTRDLGPAIIEDVVTLLIAAYATRRRAVARHNPGTTAGPGRHLDLTDDAFTARTQVN